MNHIRNLFSVPPKADPPMVEASALCRRVFAVARGVMLGGCSRGGNAVAAIVLATAGLLLTLGIVSVAWAEPQATLYDQWAAYFGLSGNDAREAADPDLDGLDNSLEYSLNLDPTSQDSDGDLLGDGEETNGLSRINLKLGDPRFSMADGQFVYPFPPWCLGARTVAGELITNAPLNGQFTNAWHVDAAAGTGAVEVAIDRSLITTQELRCAVTFFDHADSHLILELADLNGATVAEDLYGNLASGSGALQSVNVKVPLSGNPQAAIVRLKRLSGEATVFALQLYKDSENDGLDDEAEYEFGGDPFGSDRDGDGLSDFDEVVLYKTNPAAADSDGDGIGDKEELRVGMDPLQDDRNLDLDGDGVNNWSEYLMGRSVNVAGAVSDSSAQVRLTLFLPLD
ncbi:MAG: hypothetical protein HYV35_10835 [Lentisphaerae bacterium]|nr:hypothetical protein [Lentisphaerota bacterium]